MRIFFHEIVASEMPKILPKLQKVARPQLHEIVTDPAEADLILLTGSWTSKAKVAMFFDDPVLKAYPNKCAAYNDDDDFLPLVPGVYCSPVRGWSTRIGRVRSYSYITRHTQKGNPHVQYSDKFPDKDLLFSFQGSSTSWVRKRLFKLNFDREDIVVANAQAHYNWVPNQSVDESQRNYVDTIRRSHFVLCPQGGGTGSFRLFEIMQMGVCPVLIADAYVLPEGPDWDSFLIRVKNSEIAQLPRILERHKSESLERGRLARISWEAWFDNDKEFNQVVALCGAALHSAQKYEPYFKRMRLPVILLHFARKRLRGAAKNLVVEILRALNLRPPFQMRRGGVVDFDPTDIKDDILLPPSQ